jgi:hypothetical protein
MKTKLFLAAAVSALSLGAAGVQAAPVSVPAIDSITQSTDTAVEQAHHRRFYYGYYYYYPYYYNYYYCPYWKKIRGWCY